MRITIIGASAGLGKETVRQALENRFHVVALSRDTSSLPEHTFLKRINGSADHVESLMSALQDSDAAIVTLGTKKKKGTTLFSDTAKALIEACERINYQGIILIVTGFGTGNSFKLASFFIKTVIRLFLKDQYRDKELMENLISKSNIRWEFVRPGILNNKLHNGHVKVYPTPQDSMHIAGISRSNLAEFLITEAKAQNYIKHYVAVTDA